MKFALPLLAAVLLATFAACQSTDTSGPPRPSSSSNEYENTWTPPSSPERPDVERGDAYKEQMLDRYGSAEGD